MKPFCLLNSLKRVLGDGGYNTNIKLTKALKCLPHFYLYYIALKLLRKFAMIFIESNAILIAIVASLHSK